MWFEQLCFAYERNEPMEIRDRDDVFGIDAASREQVAISGHRASGAVEGGERAGSGSPQAAFRGLAQRAGQGTARER